MEQQQQIILVISVFLHAMAATAWRAHLSSRLNDFIYRMENAKNEEEKKKVEAEAGLMGYHFLGDNLKKGDVTTSEISIDWMQASALATFTYGCLLTLAMGHAVRVEMIVLFEDFVALIIVGHVFILATWAGIFSPAILPFYLTMKR